MSLRFTRIYLVMIALSTCYPGMPIAAQAEEPAAASSEPAGYQAVTTLDPEIPLDQLGVLIKPLTKSELEVEAKAWFELLRVKARQIAAVQLGVKKTNEAMTAEDRAVADAALKSAEAVQERAAEQADAVEEQITDAAQEQLGVKDVEASTSEASVPSDVTTPSEQPSSEEVAEFATTKKQELLSTVSELQEQRTGLVDRLEVVLNSLAAKGGDVEEMRAYMTEVSGIDLDAGDASATWAAIGGWIRSKEGGQRWAWNIGKFFTILFISYFLAKIVAGITNWLLERKLTLSQLAENLISRLIKDVIMLVGVAVALTALEIDIAPILAAIGAAGFIIAFALQGTLSNFASGLLILVNRPFDVGDVVSAGGVTGQIHEMNLVATTFRTFDNQTIFVPNNEIWGNVITNITANDRRRVDLEFGISYDDDVDEAERIIREVVELNECVLKEPEPVITLHELGDSAVKIVCRPWAKTSDWWAVKTQVTRQVKKRFDAAGISFPYPQREVHVHAPPEVALLRAAAESGKS